MITLEEQGKNVFFEIGSADLTDQMKATLDQLAPAFLKLAEKRHDLIVEGHTDNVPGIQDGPVCVQLGTVDGPRDNVVRYSLASENYPKDRIAAVGYGENKPIPRAKDEDLVAWRSKNRRVVFLFKNPVKQPASEAPGAPGAPETAAAPASKS